MDQRQVIGQVELLPILVSKTIWNEFLKNRWFEEVLKGTYTIAQPLRELSGILKVGASDPKDDDLTQPVIMPFKITKHHACVLAWNTGL